MKYYLVMKNEIIKLVRKWFNLEKIIFCGGNHDPQRQMPHILTHLGYPASDPQM